MQEKEDLIIDKCIKWINKGTYKSNKKLPSENELADKLDVPRIIIRRAYERLDLMGYTYSKQGKGRFVRSRKDKISLILSGKESFTEKIEGLGHKLETRLINVKKIEYNEEIYNSLILEQRDIVYKISRLRIVNNEPMAIHSSYVSAASFPNILKDSENIKSMFEYHARQGYTNLTSSSSILYIAYPNAKERKILDCQALVPLLTLESNCIDKDTGRVLEHTVIKYRSDCFDYIIG